MTIKRKGREKEQRHNTIIIVTERLFLDRGIDNVTMEDIAKEAEVAKGTLYLYFKDKDELVLAIILKGVIGLNEKFHEAYDSEASGLDKAYAFGVAFYQSYKDKQSLMKALEYATSEKMDPCRSETASEIGKVNRENLVLLCGAISMGIEDGSIISGLDPVKTAIFLIESTQAMIMLPMGLRGALGELNVGHDELVYHSLGLLKRAIANDKKEA